MASLKTSPAKTEYVNSVLIERYELNLMARTDSLIQNAEIQYSVTANIDRPSYSNHALGNRRNWPLNLLLIEVENKEKKDQEELEGEIHYKNFKKSIKNRIDANLHFFNALYVDLSVDLSV